MSDFVRRGLVRVGVGNYMDPADPGEQGYPGAPKRRSVTDDEARVLARWADGLRVLEIGTGLGVATRALASPAASVVTVDPDPWVCDPGIPRVTFRRDLAGLDPHDFGLAFIDGNHAREAVERDIEFCRPVPLLALHDTYLPDVAEAIERTGLVLVEATGSACKLALYTAGAQ